MCDYKWGGSIIEALGTDSIEYKVDFVNNQHILTIRPKKDGSKITYKNDAHTTWTFTASGEAGTILRSYDKKRYETLCFAVINNPYVSLKQVTVDLDNQPKAKAESINNEQAILNQILEKVNYIDSVDWRNNLACMIDDSVKRAIEEALK